MSGLVRRIVGLSTVSVSNLSKNDIFVILTASLSKVSRTLRDVSQSSCRSLSQNLASRAEILPALR